MNSPEQFRDAGPGRITVLTQGLAAAAMRSSAKLRTKIMNAGQVADFLAWQEDTFPEAVPGFRRREDLWKAISKRLDPTRPLLVLEFGVAWGYATATWMDLLGSRQDVEWHGFDRFTGLPRAWREHDAGAFDADGKAPALNDKRVTWHVGDVEERLRDLNLADFSDHQIFGFFDLDIFEPSLFAWERLLPYLKAGDLLYFDEAMDSDERRLLNEYVLRSELELRPIGATPIALALSVD